MQPVSGIVTPEAVVLDFQTAGVGSRMLAGIVDLIVRGLLLAGLTVAIGQLPDLGAAGAALGFLGVFAVLFVYPVVFEVLWRGRTPGKAAMGLRVVTVEGGPERFRHAAIRAALGLVDTFFLFGSIGILTMLATSRTQRLGDLVAGTVVLRERTGARLPEATRFLVPPGFEAYAAALDVAALSGPERAAVRSFLVRAPSLPAGPRQAVAADVARPIAVALRHAPPPAMPPELFLACVAAAVQRASWSAPRPAVAPVTPSAPARRSAWSDVEAPPAGSPPLSPPVPSPLPSPSTASDGDGFTPIG